MVNNNECKIYRYARHLPSVLNKTNNIYRNALTACTYKFATWLGWTLGCLSLGKPWAPWSLATWPTCHLVTCHLAYLPLGHLSLGLLSTQWTPWSLSLSEHFGHYIKFDIINNVSQSFDFPCYLVPYRFRRLFSTTCTQWHWHYIYV